MKILAFILKNFQPIIYALLGFFVLKTLKEVLSKPSEEKLKNDEELPVSNTKTTITNVQAQVIADNIYNASIESGTDEALLYAQFDKLKNQNDFNAVYNAFGKRQYSKFWGNVGDPVTSDKHDMIAILTNELTTKEQEYLKNNYPHLTIF
ncbi:hypothetical protein [Wocania ichthyoenteri]|uniref:hypothetical protein n=1 Tax=Wocania ichthyoenteri TaxID=1230531 RepID=UPI00053DAC50|nr:hypothetical protein [Wocania ichthyoenteri]